MFRVFKYLRVIFEWGSYLLKTHVRISTTNLTRVIFYLFQNPVCDYVLVLHGRPSKSVSSIYRLTYINSTYSIIYLYWREVIICCRGNGFACLLRIMSSFNIYNVCYCNNNKCTSPWVSWREREHISFLILIEALIKCLYFNKT